MSVPSPELPSEPWQGRLEDLVELANALLERLLPDAAPGTRTPGLLNPRLVRHYTTAGLLDEPGRQGREALYTRRHLLQLLALRRLMANGYGSAAVHDLLRGRTDAELEAVATGEPRVTPRSGNPALDYLDGLRGKHGLVGAAAGLVGDTVARMVPPPAALPPAAPAPRPALPPPAAAPDAEPTPDPVPERWTRVTVEPGLEVHVHDTYRPPRTPAERDRLAQAILARLAALGRKP